MNDKKYFQTFTVRGSRGFPTDMLRYDQCFPIEGGHFIDYSIRGQKPEDPYGYEIKLGRWVDHWSRTPTEGRWSSFLWSVRRDSIRTAVEGELIPAYNPYEEA